jgi:hypothetical protein
MLKRANAIGAVLGTVAVLAFVLVQTGAKPRPNVPPAAIGAGDFTAEVSPTEIQVTCAPGATVGTADVQVKVARRGASARLNPGDILGPNRRVVVTWPGGQGSVTITRFDRFYQAGPGSTFPCPAQAGEPGAATFRFQLFVGASASGDAVSVNVTVQRLGSAS